MCALSKPARYRGRGAFYVWPFRGTLCSHASVHTRPLDSVILDSDISTKVYNDVTDFFQRKVGGTVASHPRCALFAVRCSLSRLIPIALCACLLALCAAAAGLV